MSAYIPSSLVGFVLLLVEPTLLVMTLVLLFLSRTEEMARDSLMGHLSTAVDVLTRQEYFLAVQDSVQKAERYVCANITGNPPTSEEPAVVERIMDAVSRAVSRGVKVEYLLPRAVDVLSMAHRYTNANA